MRILARNPQGSGPVVLTWAGHGPCAVRVCFEELRVWHRARSGPAICGFPWSTSRSGSTRRPPPSARIAFHQIHEPSGKRIRYQKVAPGVGPVENEEITKGYEYEKGKYVLIDQKEIDDLKLESKQTIELVRFVDEDAIDIRYFETPYYLMPDGDMADEAYVIVQKALKDTGKIGVGQFILRGHGNIVAIRPFGKGLMLEVLRHANEVRAAEPLFKEIAEVKVDKEALDLAKELIKRKAGKFEPEQFKDDYSEAVWELINAKLEHRAPEIVDRAAGHRQGHQHHGCAEEERAARQGRSRRQDRRQARRLSPFGQRQEGGEGRA